MDSLVSAEVHIEKILIGFENHRREGSDAVIHERGEIFCRSILSSLKHSGIMTY